MDTFLWILRGGFAKGYRTQIFGVLAALTAVANFAVGDMSLTDLLGNLPMLLGGLGLTALGAKVNTATETGKVN